MDNIIQNGDDLDNFIRKNKKMDNFIQKRFILDKQKKDAFFDLLRLC